MDGEKPYLDRDGLRKQIAENPVPEGIPDVTAPESKKEQLINIPKNSRLAFNLAFYYNQDPKIYNHPEGGVVDLQGYLNWVLNFVAAGHTEVLKSLPENCQTAEDCLEIMSDQEIKDEIELWKQHKPDDANYQAECGKYLNYLLTPAKQPKQTDASEAKPDKLQSPEQVLKDLKIETDGLPYKLKAEFKTPEGSSKFYLVKLPPAAKAATPEEVEKYIQAFHQMLTETKGHFFPRYAVDAGRLVACFGADSKRSSWFPVKEFSAEELVELTGKNLEEAKKYLVFRAKKFSELTADEIKTRDEFENIINNAGIKIFDSERGVSIKQALRSLAVAEKWADIVGADRVNTLKEQAKVVSKENDENRWGVNDKIYENPEFKARADKFLELAKGQFGSWENLLSRNSSLSEFTSKARITVPEALFILGKNVLTGKRQGLYSEYEQLFRQSRKDLLENNIAIAARDEVGANKPKILKEILFEYVQKNPQAGDVWEKVASGAKPVITSAEAESIKIIEQPYVRKSYGLQSLTNENLDTIAEAVFGKGS